MNELLRANLAHLDSTLADTVARAHVRADEIIDRSRDGYQINGVESSGRARFFHSRYSVDAECARLVDTARPAGFLVVFGLGLAHHVRRFADAGIRVVVVEPDPALIRSALSRMDLTQQLRSGRIRVVFGPEGLVDAVATHYNASLDGRLMTVDLDGRVSVDPASFQPFRVRLNDLVGSIVADVTTQAAFARQWVRNAIGNLVATARGEITTRALPDWSGRHVVVAAAGPSLEAHIDWIARNRAGVFLLATDTALPSLQSFGTQPDLVASIDCQHISYMHELTALERPAQRACDLSVPGHVAASADAVTLLLSHHPLHQFLSLLGYAADTIDAGDGTVTGASVRLALSRDARSVTLAGADLSYPNGFGYCRGSYIDAFHAARANRVDPLCGRHFSFVADRPGLVVDPKTGVRTTGLMLTYRERLITAARAAARPVFALPCDLGLPLPAPPLRVDADPQRTSRASTPELEQPSVGTPAVADLLRVLRDRLHAVPRDEIAYRASLDLSREPLERAAASCLLPAVHARRVAGDASPLARVLHEAADEIVGIIDAGLSALRR